MKNWVSIPHRYAENIATIHKSLRGGLVSIPHRYAENHQPEEEQEGGKAFQSLIGMLKTQQLRC